MNEDWIKVENFIDKNTANLLYGHTLLASKRLRVMKELDSNFPINSPTQYGTYGDPTSVGNFCCYGDLIFDSLLLGKTSELEKITGLSLTPQYTYYRIYTSGSHLQKHIDRPSCELSLTLCLGYDANYKWPMWFRHKNGQKISVETDVGDAIIYKGGELEHWREPFEGVRHSQVFLHYTIKGSEHDDVKFDGRPALGLFKEYYNFDNAKNYELHEKMMERK
tara:strand:- start:632 stop:1294 length:663 start_codon:yes stop_codon:yes gene_type:complete